MEETTVSIMIRVPVRYTVRPGSPGRTSGPPELCYPAEEAEIEWDMDIDPDTLHQFVYDALNQTNVEEQLSEQAKFRLWHDDYEPPIEIEMEGYRL